MFLDTQKPERGYKNWNRGTKTSVPGPQNPERGYKKRNDSTKHRNKGTFAQTALLQNRPFVSSRLLTHSNRAVQTWVGMEWQTKDENAQLWVFAVAAKAQHMEKTEQRFCAASPTQVRKGTHFTHMFSCRNPQYSEFGAC